MRYSVLIFCVWMTCLVQGQTVNMLEECQMPAYIVESSGLEQLPNDHYITHNDGGIAREIYEFDNACNVLRTVYLDSIVQVDFEDIAVDDSGNVYVGDFGNNNTNHGRMDLVVYRIDSLDFATKDTVVPQFIYFSYSDQIDFAPPASNKIYDCESMVHYGDSLYLFSKRDATALSHYTRCYVIPDQQGTYVAQLRDSLLTDGRINAADFDPVSGQLALTSDSSLWLCQVPSPPDWFDGSHQEYAIQNPKKYEGLKVLSANNILVSNDTQGQPNSRLYTVNFSALSDNETLRNPIKLYPNPASSELYIEHNKTIKSYVVYDQFGRQVLSGRIEGDKAKISIDTIENGSYICRFVLHNGEVLQTMFVKL